jgi:hypothetical protein
MDARRILPAALAAALLFALPATAAPAKKAAKATPAKAAAAPAEEKTAPAEKPAPAAAKEEPAPAPKTKPRTAAPAKTAPAPEKASPVAGLEVGIAGMMGVGYKGTIDSRELDTYHKKLHPSGGFGVHALYEVLPYLDVGGRFTAMWWQAKEKWDDGVPIADHGTLLDISAVVKAKMRFYGDRLEVFGKVPVGLTVSVLEKLDNVTKGRTGVGANVGVLAGASWTFLRHYGIFLEAGYAFHWVRHSGEVTANVLGFPVTATDVQKYWAHEFALDLGFAYRF